MEFLKRQMDKHKIIIIMAVSVIVTRGECLIKRITGVPCPSCGLTRSLKAFIRLDFHEGFYYHPLSIFIVISILYFIYSKKPMGGSKKSQILIISMVLVIILGTYAYRMYNLFPNIAPMDFNNSSLFGKLYEFVIELVNMIK